MRKDVIQPTGFTRREFLELALIAGGALATGEIFRTRGKRYDSVFKIDFDKFDEFWSFNECSQLAKRMDKLYDKLPEYKASMTKEDLLKWGVEMIPMFEYEGIVTRANYPPVEGIGFIFFPDGDSHNHVAGRSDCANYAGLNLRYANEHSAWYQDDDAPFTLLHELAHIQQGQQVCMQADRSLVENSATIAALEVGAAMVNQGNREMLTPLISELRGMAISSAYAAALKTNQMGAYLELRSQLSPGAVSEAKFAKARRRWSNDPTELMTILDRYNVTPLNMISKAIRENNSEIEGLAFPPRYADVRGGAWTIQVNNPLPIKLDDLKYFLANAEAIVYDVTK